MRLAGPALVPHTFAIPARLLSATASMKLSTAPLAELEGATVEGVELPPHAVRTAASTNQRGLITSVSRGRG